MDSTRTFHQDVFCRILTIVSVLCTAAAFSSKHCALAFSHGPASAFLRPSTSLHNHEQGGGRRRGAVVDDDASISRSRHRTSLYSNSNHDGNNGAVKENDTTSWSVADWSAALSTQRLDRPIAITETIGKLPSDFPHGILYKTGPARFENENSGTPYSHWLEGDGAVVRLELNPVAAAAANGRREDCVGGGIANFTYRFVETELYNAERNEGRILSRGTFGTKKDDDGSFIQGLLGDAFDFKLKNPCNTHVVRFGGSSTSPDDDDSVLLALSEVGLPQRLDPNTLSPLGAETFDERLVDGAPAATIGIPILGPVLDSALGFGDAVCAHYRIIDGRIAFASMRQDAITSDTCLRMFEIDVRAPGRRRIASDVSSVLHGTGFPPHDWVMTPNYAVFVATPAGGDLTPFLLGKKGPAECISFRRADTATDGESSRLRATVHFVPRVSTTDGTVKRDALRVELPVALHPVHFANAWENEGHENTPSVEIYATCWSDERVNRMAATGESLLGSWAKVKGGDFDGIAVQRVMRIRTGGTESEPTVEEAIPSLGHVDYVKGNPNFAGRQSTRIWGAIAGDPEWAVTDEPAPVAPPQAFCRLDLSSKRKVDEWYAGPRKFVDDFVIIPKSREEEDGGEDHVWLLAPVFDAETKTSSFVLLQGDNLSAGPIFEARLNSHIPWGLHGSWYGLSSQHRIKLKNGMS
mmetsp:Transcript_4151/g.9319  ORF Transcript_4151/g.9319 Transcript_4151/m.9319 type:complete len:695 (-) Transcript_4151:71-2155(-)